MPTRQRPTKVKVPLYGNVNRAAFVEDGSTVGARIGLNLQLPDGSVPSLEQLAIALGVGGDDTTIITGGPQPTIWSLILEVPIYTAAGVSPAWVFRIAGVNVGTIGIAAANDAIAAGSLVDDIVLEPVNAGRVLAGAPMHVIDSDIDPDADVVLDVEATPTGALTPVYIGSTTLGSMNPSITFTGVAIGTAASDRKVVVVFEAIQSGGSDLNPTMTIGGVAATRVKTQNGQADSGGNAAHCSIFELNVPTGTTANIVVTSAGDVTFDSTISVYNLFGASDTLFDSDSVGGAAAASTDLNVDVPEGGAVIAGAVEYDFLTPGFTWTGLTEDNDQTVYSNDRRGAASFPTPAAESPRAVNLAFTGTITGNLSRAACIVVFSPEGLGPGRGRVGTTTPNEFAIITDDVNRLTFADDGSSATFSVDLVIDSTGYLELPNGTIAQRPGSPQGGMLRYNDDIADIEGYIDGQWVGLRAGMGGALSSEWRFSTTTSSGDPGSRIFRLNNATLGSATEIYISEATNLGGDAATVFSFLESGNTIYIQQVGDSTRGVLFEVSGTPTDNGAWWTIPVSVLFDTGVLFTNNAKCGISVAFGSGATPPASSAGYPPQLGYAGI